ncbi:hypothetical protein D5F53_28055 [Paenibacillus lautus]|uniref:Uncharacterized protein n=1 Tax=Paenibacillus lautus TaxID=1401 RepID=A0A385TSZ6_PAELA|nr:hypothetical protein D5F53_28055 [Paenibacillus lautus]
MIEYDLIKQQPVDNPIKGLFSLGKIATLQEVIKEFLIIGKRYQGIVRLFDDTIRVDVCENS